MSEGPLDAPIVFCGRDYGFEEQRAGRPFVGAAGKLLDRAFGKVGLDRHQVLITNVVNKRPAGNKWEAHDEGTIRRGIEELRDLLSHTPRHLIVALGAEAFQACRGLDPRTRPEVELDGNGITELRGYCFDGPYGPVLAATHPAFILRTWLPWWPCFLWDLAKAKRLVEKEPPKLHGYEHVGPLSAEALAWMSQGGTKTCAVDIETSGPHAERIECIAFAWDEQNGYAVPFEENRDCAVEVLASASPKVFHNGQFDVTILERHGLHVNNWTEDSMILFHCLEPLIAGRSKEKNSQTQKSLRFLVSLLTDEPWYKDYSFTSDEDRLRLCAKDARLTWTIWNKLTAMLASTGVSLATTSPLRAMTSGSPS